MFRKKTSPVGYRAMIQSSDDSITLVEFPNRVSWRRDESLSTLNDAVMLDLPVSFTDAAIEQEFDDKSTRSPTVVEMFMKRIKTQSTQVSTWISTTWNTLNSKSSLHKTLRDPLITVGGLTRDPFSLHKMIVAVSTTGTVFGLDSINGAIVWKYYDDDLKGRNVRIFVQRTTAHYPHPPQAVVIGTKDGSDPVVLQFNPITGEFNKQSSYYKNMDGRIMQAFLLPFSDKSHLKSLVLVSDKREVRLFPISTPRQVLSRDDIYLYDVNKEDGVVNGYKLNGDAEAEHTWNIRVPKSHKIIACEGKYQMEKIDSLGRPLANRSVIYKYLNPNVVTMISESIDDNTEKSSLLTHVFDAVTGRIIHSHVHKRSRGPVHVVNSENWIIYSYKHLKNRRNELMSIEMYEGEQQVNKTAFTSFQNRPQPIIFQQAYIFPNAIAAMGVSRTERAISSRQILFALRNGAVFGLVRRLFDPRRPLYPEKRHQEENLIPYIPEMPVPHELMLSYNLTVENMNAIYTAPAALESTSLVFVTGLDLFFTRTQPSKMFDVLKDDFDHYFISSVLIGMLVTLFAVRRLAQVKQLNKAWK